MDQLTTLHTICKRKVKSWVYDIIDLVYPPICAICHSASRQLICLSCFELLSLIDNTNRCRHCFTSLETSNPSISLCRQCAHSVKLPIPRAYLFESSPLVKTLENVLADDSQASLQLMVASFLVVLWNRLDWPYPDRIMIVPNIKHRQSFLRIAKEFARMLDLSICDEFRMQWIAPFEWRLMRKKEDYLENQKILLLDWGSNHNRLHQVLRELGPAFPGPIQLLSIFKND